MNKINSFIDHCLLDEYAVKSIKYPYSLDVDDLPKNEIETFLDLLMEDDSSVKDFVLSQMQELINERLSRYESEDRSYKNQYATIDNQSGETIWGVRI